MEASGNVRKPMVVAAIICDQAIREEGTGKWSLVGIFSEMAVDTLPAIHPLCYLYLAVTSLDQQSEVEVHIGHDGAPTMARMKATIQAADPLVQAELALRLVNMPILHEGFYHVDILFQGDRIGGTKFRVGRRTP